MKEAQERWVRGDGSGGKGTGVWGRSGTEGKGRAVKGGGGVQGRKIATS